MMIFGPFRQSSKNNFYFSFLFRPTGLLYSRSSSVGLNLRKCIIDEGFFFLPFLASFCFNF